MNWGSEHLDSVVQELALPSPLPHNIFSDSLPDLGNQCILKNEYNTHDLFNTYIKSEPYPFDSTFQWAKQEEPECLEVGLCCEHSLSHNCVLLAKILAEHLKAYLGYHIGFFAFPLYCSENERRVLRMQHTNG